MNSIPVVADDEFEYEYDDHETEVGTEFNALCIFPSWTSHSLILLTDFSR